MTIAQDAMQSRYAALRVEESQLADNVADSERRLSQQEAQLDCVRRLIASIERDAKTMGMVLKKVGDGNTR